MAIYADADGSNVFASMQTLASDMSMDRKTVNRRVIKLRNAGWLIPEGAVSRFNHTIVYRIHINQISNHESAEHGVREKHDTGVVPPSKGESLPYRERHDAPAERGVVTLTKGAQRPTTRSSNQIIYTRSSSCNGPQKLDTKLREYTGVQATGSSYVEATEASA